MSLFPKDRDLSESPERVEIEVRASDLRLKKEAVNVRLDAFLTHHLHWRSRTSIQDLIHEGFVQVDAATPDHPKGTGEPTEERRPGRRLRHGTKVVVVIPEALRLPTVEGLSEELVILYEDREVLAVDKPPMLASHPAGRHLGDTLIRRVHAHYRDVGLPEGFRPRLCHRLDRETSGLLLVSKNPRTHPMLMAQFENRLVEKEYLAIVEGVPDRERGIVDLPLGPCRASRVGLKMAVRYDGVESRTAWRVLECRADCALLSCRPHTGRQHQIRVHMAATGHSLVGDKLYGPDEDLFQRGIDGTLTAEDLRVLRMPRHALHNHRLAFRTPDGNRVVEVECPLAPDMRAFLESATPLGEDRGRAGGDRRSAPRRP